MESDNTMNEYEVMLEDKLGNVEEFTVSVPDLVENVTEYVREEYPESSIVYIMPKGFWLWNAIK